ncbi:hypothetical protein [Solemya velum gill symbiont]|uniref:hypothetical protein n=1 Tax=Solemya velum gill symbiont TaxID=2340 RepID=UPI002118162E|nr:hypothetical protein [Solemya velum gill symbiont]
MSDNPQVDRAHKTTSTRAHKTTSTAMILTLGLVTALSGFLVVFVYQATKPVIAENKRLAIEQAVLQVIPGAESFTPMLLTEDALVPVAPGIEGTRVYAGYDGENSFIGRSTRLCRYHSVDLWLQAGLRMRHRYQGDQAGGDARAG